MKKVKLLVILLLICGCSESKINKEKKEDVVEKINYLEKDTCYQYYYGKLNKKDKKLYQDIYNCVIQQESETQINNGNIDHVSQISDYILQDHPEIFYLEEWTIMTIGDVHTYQPTYTFTKTKVKEYNQELDQVKEDIKKQTEGLETYDKIQYIYEYAVNHCTYQETARYNQEIISSIINQKTVCSGYAKMIQYLLQDLGIDCTYIRGTSIERENQKSESHAWNMVKYENDYYYIDATWADQEAEDFTDIFYDYFMFDSEDMLQLYQPANYYENTTNQNYTFFIKKGLYFSSYQKNDIASAIRNNGKTSISIQFSDDIYEYAKNRLANEGDAYTILEKAGYQSDEIQYIANDPLNIIYLTW